MKKKILHMIGNAHIDPVWLWTWQEGFHEVKATFRSALDRMKEYPDFMFVASSAAFYEWVEQSDPEMFREIQQRVAEGRWEIVGGWWVEPDCNIPAGESFVRHGLYAQRYFFEKFGKIATTGFNIDSFGHSNTLPQILLKSGIEHYVFLRPMPHEKSLPARLFWWETGDGSRVLAFRIPFEYLSWGKELDHHIQRCAGEMKEPLDEFMCFYGVGNHGGGPTIQNIESIHRLNEDAGIPYQVVCSSPGIFFQHVKEKQWNLPVIRDELQNHASGCYSAHSGIKRWNRMAEHRLLASEKWCSLANWMGGPPYPASFTHAWKQVLFNQFHDVLAGTSLPEAYEDARNGLGEAISIADRNLNLALQFFVWNIAIPKNEDVIPLVVFNPHTWRLNDVVEIESRPLPANAVMCEADGEIVPLQFVQSHTVTNRVRLCFPVDLPPLGYRTYWIHSNNIPSNLEEKQKQMLQTSAVVKASDQWIETERFRLEFDPQTGCILSLRDKWASVEVFSGPAATPLVLNDPSDTWGHNTFRWDDVCGTFRAESVRLVEHGPVKSVIRVISRYQHSTLIQDFSVYPHRHQIDVHGVVDWREQNKMLKLRFPVNVKFMKITRETPYGHIEHYANGDEYPVQSWVDISGISRDREIPYGFSLLNDGKYSLDVNVRDIGLTILRSPAYAHHIPAELKSEKVYTYIDQGIQEFNYTMLPHEGSWEEARVVRQAQALNQRPFALFATFHPEGMLPLSDSFLLAEPDNIMVTVLKHAEDGQAFIVRAYETNGWATQGRIELPKWGRTIQASFAPGEIKTFWVPRDPALPVKEVNLLEWE